MAIYATPKLELLLTTDWADVTADVIADEPVTARYGIQGYGPTRRTASPGKLDFVLDNSSDNSAGLPGYYTPGSTDCRAGFAVGVQARFSLTYDSDTYYKFVGYVKQIKPTSGKWGGRNTKCVCGDWIDEASQLRPTGIDIQDNKTGSELMTTALAAVTRQPQATNFSTGKSTFELAFDEIRDGQTTLLQIIENITNSEFGQCALIGDSDTGGVLRWWDRHTWPTTTNVLVTLTDSGGDDDWDELNLEIDERTVYNTIKTQCYPRAVDATASNVLWELTGDDISIAAGQSQVIIGDYRDPDNPDVRVGGKDIAATTSDDYTWSLTASDLGIVVDAGGNSVKFTLTNNSAATGTLSKLQIRGKRVLIYQPQVAEALDSDSIASYGDHPLNMSLKYQNKITVGQDFTDTTLAWYKTPALKAPSVSFNANQSTNLMAATARGEPGRLILIQDTVNAINHNYMITGVELKLTWGRQLDVTWMVDKHGVSTFWILDVSALDDNTILAF